MGTALIYFRRALRATRRLTLLCTQPESFPTKLFTVVFPPASMAARSTGQYFRVIRLEFIECRHLRTA